MKFSILNFIFFGISAINVACFSQSYSFKTYSIAEGLAQTQVKAITEDENGYLWIGTLGGLSRFNGSSFVNYSSEDGLINNRISALYATKNELWIGHFGGGISLLKNGKIKNWNFGNLNKNISVSKIIYFKNKLFIATNGNGLYVLENNKLSHYALKSEDANRIRGFEVIDDELYLATREGLFKTKEKIEFNKIKNLSDINLTGIVTKEKQIILTTTNGEIFQYFPSSKLKKILKIEQELFLYSCIIDSKNNIWSTCNSGLISKNSSGQTQLINESQGLPLNALNCVFEDINGTIWIGSDGKGLFRFGGNSFVHYNQSNGIQSNLIISGIEISKNKFLFGSYENGLILYENKGFTSIPLDKSRIWATIQDDLGNIFLGTDEGLIYYNPLKNSKSRKIDEKIKSKVTCFFKEKNGEILFGGTEGISKIINGNTILIQQEFNFTKIGTIRNIIRYQNKLICATDGGLFEFKNGIYTNFLAFKNTSFSLKVDNQNSLWIGSDIGLFCFNGKKLKKVFLSDQPASNFVNFINYATSKIYVGTNNGLYVLSDLEKNENASKIRYGIEDGLVNLETNINSSFFDSYGNFWFGTAEGLVKFSAQINTKYKNYYKPSLNINNIKVNFLDINYKEFELNTSNVPFPQKMILAPNKNNLLIELDGVLLKNHQSIKYQYWLEGYDDKWVPPFTSPQISLSNLPSGKYKLHIRSINEQEDFSEEKVIELEIRPYFYKTWWFISLSIIFIGFIVFLIFRFRLNQEKAKRYKESLEFKSKLIVLEQQSLNASMNRHFIFNSLNSIQYFINTQDKISANKFLTNFAKLIRKNLDSSSENENQIALNQEIERLDLYLSLESMRFKDRFEYKINVGNIDTESIIVPAMLFQPFVENSIIHGILPNEKQKGFINIKMEIIQEDGHKKLVVSICDNGVGIDSSLKKKSLNNGDHKSQGMEITRKRINLLNELSNQKYELKGPFQLEDENRLIKGTCILIKIPIKDLED